MRSTDPGCWPLVVSALLCIPVFMFIEYLLTQPVKGPEDIPNLDTYEIILALEDATVGTLVTIDEWDSSVHVVCSRRGYEFRRIRLDIRENIAACNIESHKEERTAWGWVVDPGYKGLPSVSGVALPCGHPLRERVINDELRALVPACAET